MKKLQIKQITLMALAIALNFIAGNLMLFLRMPIYLDTIGTILSAALFGPFAGVLVGLTTAVITGVTTDVFSLYYAPVQVCIGTMAGILLYRKKIAWSLPVRAFLITLPGTLLATSITILLFGGITSSGSSMLVQLLHGLGLNQAVSVFLVQIGTDYLDRLLSVVLVVSAIQLLPHYRQRLN